MILLLSLTQDDAMQVAEDIRKAVFGLRVPIVNTRKRPTHLRGLSVSIGVAPYPAAGSAIHKLLNAANIALDFANSDTTKCSCVPLVQANRTLTRHIPGAEVSRVFP